MSEHAGEADKIEQSYRNGLTYATKHKETRKHKRFRQKIVFVKCKKNRHTIIKEEEDRQEEADVKHFLVKNGYTDLKRRHQNAKIRKIFKWADRGKH